MDWRSRCSKSETGFTLIELVTVIVMLGVLSIYMAPHMFNSAAFNSRGLHDETLSFLRYAQKTAIAQRRVVCIAFTLNSASLTVSSTPAHTTCDAPLSGPHGDVPGVLKAGTGAAYSTLPVDFNFNGLGQPVDGAGAAMATQTLQVNDVNSAITVETTTGYVHE